MRELNRAVFREEMIFELDLKVLKYALKNSLVGEEER